MEQNAKHKIKHKKNKHKKKLKTSPDANSGGNKCVIVLEQRKEEKISEKSDNLLKSFISPYPLADFFEVLHWSIEICSHPEASVEEEDTRSAWKSWKSAKYY